MDTKKRGFVQRAFFVFPLFGIVVLSLFAAGTITSAFFGYKVFTSSNQSSQQVSEVLGEQAPALLAANSSSSPENPQVSFNVASVFNENATFHKNTYYEGEVHFGNNIFAKDKLLDLGDGTIKAGNIVYGISAGEGIKLDGTVQSPKIVNTGVLSVQGKTGTVNFTAGNGIVIEGTTIKATGTNAIVSLTGGSGITTSGSEITNADPGSGQYIFKTIQVSGSPGIMAGFNNDTLTFASGSGIQLSTDPKTKTIVIGATGQSIGEGWLSGSGVVSLTSNADNVGIGTTSPTSKLQVAGSTYLGGPVTISGTPTFSTLSSSSGGFVKADSSGVLYTSQAISLIHDITGVLPVALGGTGLSTLPSSGQILVGNGSGYSLMNITGNSGVSVDTSGSSLVLSGTGVTSLSGLSGIITVTGAGIATVSTNGSQITVTATEADTLATVTGRGAVTTSPLMLMGNVGIGISTPASQRLEVFGGIKMGSIAGANNILDTQSNGSTPSSSLYWGNRTIVDSANVSSFQAVTSVANYDGTLTVSPTFGAVGASLNLSHINSWTAAQTFTQTTNFAGNGVWDSTGKVGIGTTNPSTLLSLESSSAYESPVISLKNITGSVTESNFGPGILLNNGIIGKQAFILSEEQTEASIFSIARYNTPHTRYVVVTQAGNVGIGTTSPQQNLSVFNGLNIDQADLNNGGLGNALTFGSGSQSGIGSRRTSGASQYGLDFYTGNTARLTISQLGSVGIGTTSPLSTTAFSVVQTNAADIVRLERTGTVSQAYGFSIDSASNFRLEDKTNTVIRLLMNGSDGNIGIGTTTPGAKLDVTGTVSMTGFRLTTGASNAYILTSDANGYGQWQPVGTGGSICPNCFLTGGNGFAAPAVLGTTDTQPLTFITSNVERGRFTESGGFQIGSAGQFIVDANGKIASSSGVVVSGNIAATGTVSAGGTVTFSALPGGILKTASPSGQLSVAVGGVDYEDPLSFGNGLARTNNSIVLGGTLTSNVNFTLGGNSMLLNGTGNVGIGTTAPTQRLEVNGGTQTTELRIRDSSGTNYISLRSPTLSSSTSFLLPAGDGTTGQVLSTNGSGTLSWASVLTAASAFMAGGNSFSANAVLGTNDNYPLILRTNSNERIRIDTAGNMGIGITNPTALFQVYGNNPRTVLQASNISGDTGNVIYGGPDIGNSNYVRFGIDNGGTLLGTAGYAGFLSYKNGTGTILPISFSTSWGVSNMVISTSGNVGIGTTVPGAKLEVNGTALATTFAAKDGGSGYAVGFQAPSLSASKTWTLPAADGVTGQVLSTNGSGALSWASTLTASSAFMAGGNNFSTNAILGTNDNYPLVLRAGGSDKIWLNTNGNLGVGTNNPSLPFHIYRATNNSSMTDMQTLMVADSGGSGRVDTFTFSAGATSARGGKITFGESGGSFPGESESLTFALNSLTIAQAGDYSINFNTNGNQRMSIEGNGNVGIGISPSQKLDVNGTVQATGLKIPTGATVGYVLTSDVSGNATWQVAAGGSGVPSGTSGQTLRHNGSAWSATSNLYNDGTSIGIGTTSLDRLLTIGANTTGAQGVHIVNSGQGYSDLLMDTGTSNGQVFQAANTINWNGTGNGSGVFQTSGNLVLAAPMNTPRLHINASTGNIGIGVINATQKLEINGGIKATSFTMPTGASNGYIMVSDSSGNGTWQSVSGGFTCTGCFVNNGNSFNTLATFGTTDNFALAFKTNNVEAMRITTGGNVGIGTTAAGSKLEVQGGTINGVDPYLWNPVTRGEISTKRGLLGIWTNSDSSNYTNVGAGAGTTAYLDGPINWGDITGTHPPGVNSNYINARFVGWIKADYSETYTFYTASDDGSRLYVNNNLVVNNWYSQGVTERSGTVALTAGTWYPIVIEYFQGSGGGSLSVSWSSASVTKALIPADHLMPPGNVIDAPTDFVINGSTSNNTSAALNVRNSSNTPLLYTLNDGNVGIGTSAPGGTLALKGNSQSRLSFVDEASAVERAALYIGSGSDDRLYIDGGAYSNGLTFQSNGNVGMGIDTNGNVSIGTTTPTGKFFVIGTETNSYGVETIASTTNNYDTPAAKPLFSLVRYGKSGNSWSNMANFSLSRYSQTGVNANTQLDINLSNGATASPDMTIMSLLANGNVGINSTSPDATLRVAGSSASFGLGPYFSSGNGRFSISGSSGEFSLLDRSANAWTESPSNGERWVQYVSGNMYRLWSGADKLVVNSSGNMGINTTSTATKLNISGIDSTTSIETADMVRFYRPAVSGVKNTNAAGIRVGAMETGINGRGRMDFTVSGSPSSGNGYGSVPDITVMSLQGNGYVGIGTTTPAARFTVSSGANDTVYLGNNTTGYGDGFFSINNQNGNLLTMAAYGGSTNLITDLGVNYALDGSNGTTKYSPTGTKKSPILRLSAEDGSVSLFGENGSGNDWRVPNHNLGVYVKSDGNVGIGNSSPGSKLDVSGNITVNTNTFLTGSGTSYFNGGNVGIGTTTADSRLKTVNGNDTVYLSYNSTGYGSGFIQAVNQVGTIFSIDSYGGTSSYLASDIGPNAAIDGGNGTTKYVMVGAKKAPTIRMNAEDGSISLFGENGSGNNWRTATLNTGVFVKSDGSVGIGNSNPSSKLDVSGNITVNTNTFLSGNSNSYIGGGNLGIGTSSPGQLLHLNNANPAIQFSNGATTRGYIAGANGNGSYSDIASTNDFVMRADSSNLVLTARNASGNILFGTGSGDSEKMRIASGGNIGMGTNSPTNFLHLNDSGYNQYTLRLQAATNNTSGRWSGIGFSGENANTKGGILFQSIGGDYSRGNMIFALNNGSNQNNVSPSDAIMILTNTGNVGIGTTSPGYKLDVAGTIRSSSGGFSFPDGTTQSTAYTGGASPWTLTGSNLYNNNAGNVGIGTTSPNQKLDVNGNITAAKLSLGLSSSGSHIFDVHVPNPAADQVFFSLGDLVNNNKPLAYFMTDGTNSNIRERNDNAIILESHSNRNTLVVKSGTVGIGTTSPGNPLTIAFNSSNTALNGVSLTNSNASGKSLYSATNDSGASMLMGVFGSSFGVGLANTSALGGSAGIVLMSDSGVGSGGTDPISFRTGGYNGSQERMRIDSAGNVGIGTTSPSYPLHITGTVVNIGYFKNTSGSTNFTIDTANSNNSSAFQFNAAGTAYWQIGKGIGTGDNNFHIYDNANNADRLVILNANGNVGIGTTNPSLGPLQMASGAYVTSGGTWTNASDRNLKENFIQIDPSVILSKINALPITQWNYKVENSSITHIGPVAQDFHALFGLGGSDTSISTIDPSGIALVGIQALSGQMNTLHNDSGLAFAKVSASEAGITSSVATISAELFYLQQQMNDTNSKLNLLAEQYAFIKDMQQLIASSSASSLGIATQSGVLTVSQKLAITDDLTVTGKTNLNDVNVLGAFTAGVLSIDGLTASGSATISAAGTLKLQTSALGNLDMMNGKVVVDTKGNLSLKEGKIIGNDSMRGQVVIKEGSHSARIDRTWDSVPKVITITSHGKANYWYEQESAAGFTINVDPAPSKDLLLDWFALW
ncbi:hypothetical protein HGA88_04200 [Candidatus Roizmanbacteria bacterium]|nr:hypothetical protein [Candidatus Roizmanbacteria bacterium]